MNPMVADHSLYSQNLTVLGGIWSCDYSLTTSGESGLVVEVQPGSCWVRWFLIKIKPRR